LELLIVAIWVACGFAAASITKGKNRGSALGWILGLVLGVVGIIIALVLPGQAPAAPAGMRTVQCPRCNAAQNVPIGAMNCECWQCKLVTDLSVTPWQR
jgi:uncharacterized membrane protein YeaQ/YmgE (transglycosylase-associated protein family)